MGVRVRATVASSILCLAFLADGAAAAGGSGAAASPPIGWVFGVRPGVSGEPVGPVSLQVGARRVLVLKRATFQFTPLGRADYTDHAVPPSALTACTGW